MDTVCVSSDLTILVMLYLYSNLSALFSRVKVRAFRLFSSSAPKFMSVVHRENVVPKINTDTS